MFENPPPPPPFVRSYNLSLIIQPSFDDWTSWHVWFDSEQKVAAAVRVFWNQTFDEQRLLDAMLWEEEEEAPTLEIFHHTLLYDELQPYISAVLGAIPTEPYQDGTVLDGTPTRMILNLPLGTLSFDWNSSGGNWRPLSQACRKLHKWLLTTPRIQRA